MILTNEGLKALLMEAYNAGYSDAMDEAYPDVGFSLTPNSEEVIDSIIKE